MKTNRGAHTEMEENITNQLELLGKEKMRLQEEINDLQRSLEDCKDQICHFEKLLLDKSQGVNRVVGKQRMWTLVHAGTVNELMLTEAALKERATKYQALKKNLLESLDVQVKLSEQNEIFQKIIHTLSDQLEARAQVLVEEETQLEEMLLKMEGQVEKEVKEKQEKKKKRFWRFWKPSDY